MLEQRLSDRLGISPDELARFCERHRIVRLAVFGSVLREDFGPRSDVDVLVEFEPGEWVGLRYFDVHRELEELLGREVDLLSREYLRAAYRDEILSSAEDLYVAA